MTCTALKVDIGDGIQFSSIDPNVEVVFQGMSPFKGSRAPAVNKPFPLGKGKKGPFRIAVTSKRRIKVKCISTTGTWAQTGKGLFIPPGRTGDTDK